MKKYIGLQVELEKHNKRHFQKTITIDDEKITFHFYPYTNFLRDIYVNPTLLKLKSKKTTFTRKQEKIDATLIYTDNERMSKAEYDGKHFIELHKSIKFADKYILLNRNSGSPTTMSYAVNNNYALIKNDAYRINHPRTANAVDTPFGKCNQFKITHTSYKYLYYKNKKDIVGIIVTNQGFKYIKIGLTENYDYVLDLINELEVLPEEEVFIELLKEVKYKEAQNELSFIRNDIEAITNSEKDYYSKIENLERKLKRKILLKQELTKPRNEVEKRYEDEFRAILKMNLVNKLEIISNDLNVYTKPIFMIYYNMICYIGRFAINMQLTDRMSINNIHISNLSFQRLIHPHVHPSSICWGNYGIAVQRTIKNRSKYGTIDFIIKFLLSFTKGDAFNTPDLYDIITPDGKIFLKTGQSRPALGPLKEKYVKYCEDNNLETPKTIEDVYKIYEDKKEKFKGVLQ